MKLQGAKRQTVFLTIVHAAVRALGLLMRVTLSRMLGAEIMGITELAQSVHMVAITPLTSGFPVAISRMTALSKPNDRSQPLLAGLWFSRTLSLVLIPALLLASPWLARWMGDMRVLPSLWCTAPCILILGYSAAYNGYCYGMEWSWLPALSELIEQFFRFVFTMLLIGVLHSLTAGWIAAVPLAATMAAELLGLWFVLHWLPQKPHFASLKTGWRKPLFDLAFPSTVSRLLNTLVRSITAIIIPLRLQQSGLMAAEATARLGQLNGMVMPILMLPCVFTSALSMVAVPKLARAETDPPAFRRLVVLCVCSGLPVAVLSTAGIYLFAPFLANIVYRQAELSRLFRICAPMTLLFAANHLTGSILSALGQQKRCMYSSLTISAATLLFTWLWAGDPALRLTGVIGAQYTGQIISLAADAIIFFRWRCEHR